MTFWTRVMYFFATQLTQPLLDETEKKVALNAMTDMWMFGMLVYQVLMQEPYWPESMKGIEVRS
jgi:hypothetical protein